MKVFEHGKELNGREQAALAERPIAPTAWFRKATSAIVRQMDGAAEHDEHKGAHRGEHGQAKESGHERSLSDW
ncbi:MAG: hypothetical protein C4346_03890 [Chloroflexota bacterium]